MKWSRKRFVNKWLELDYKSNAPCSNLTGVTMLNLNGKTLQFHCPSCHSRAHLSNVKILEIRLLIDTQFIPLWCLRQTVKFHTLICVINKFVLSILTNSLCPQLQHREISLEAMLYQRNTIFFEDWKTCRQNESWWTTGRIMATKKVQWKTREKKHKDENLL